MYPLDVVKTRIQLQVGSGATAEYTGVIDCLTKIVKKEGPSRLYKGISAPILMEAPKRATKFAANDEFSKFYKKFFGVQQLNQPLSILSGASAGAVESFVVVPFELIKIRVQDVSSKYNSAADAFFKTIKHEGPLALYNGLEATLWRHIVWNAGYFGIIHQIRTLLPEAKSSTQKTINDLAAGAIGGTFGTIFNTPFDVVKSRIQNTVNVPGVVRKYNWTLPSLALIYKEEGFSALYKGFLPKVLRLGPGGGILLVVFTATMDFFRSIHYKD
ncbi:putative mitochondrial 2-oxodicarboxylate carrier [Wickerhamomyces ciferrii]|uniref:Mitochondrial 2-oxodicarboxylate carrier n=1 Tax=Wickerhamomyces ciferrii (strain ATCC 14091 / BCRC 22168 / CBS 111 / JCM 3599 / NBRC 0793 / NRRL Y-1031 F-60-10) TaxID=1206466 RepID=K0KGF4_WICCF|nr:putative mitochondrial 2-oxodicarboxylate carrier [Wickerhamomyces ciferrii]CCH44245.1 putative mitochondrial 2-oxodicarboxylate carrier [Wickerhamomyces ciferrii]